MATPTTADVTASMESVDTKLAELAWSAAEPAEVEPPRYPWRPAIRVAAGVFAACIAVAGGIRVVDLNYPAALRVSTSTPSSSATTAAAPSSTTAVVVAQPEAWTLPPVPAAEHLVPPVPDLPPALTASDQEFLARMRASGWVIVDPQQMLSVAHQACFELRRGATRQYVLANLFATDPAIGASGAVSFYSNMVAAYDCT